MNYPGNQNTITEPIYPRNRLSYGVKLQNDIRKTPVASQNHFLPEKHMQMANSKIAYTRYSNDNPPCIRD